eukprot:5390740-Pyramimonas_sp.AAC.1
MLSRTAPPLHRARASEIASPEIAPRCSFLQTAKMASKRASKPAKTTTKRLKMAPDGSRGVQDSLKTALEAPKPTQKGSKGPSRRARRGQNH